MLSTPYHHVPYSVPSCPIPRIITYHFPYYHISYFVSSYPTLRIITYRTPCHHTPYSVSVKLTCSVCGSNWCENMSSTHAPAPPLYDDEYPPSCSSHVHTHTRNALRNHIYHILTSVWQVTHSGENHRVDSRLFCSPLDLKSRHSGNQLKVSSCVDSWSYDTHAYLGYIPSRIMIIPYNQLTSSSHPVSWLSRIVYHDNPVSSSRIMITPYRHLVSSYHLVSSSRIVISY